MQQADQMPGTKLGAFAKQDKFVERADRTVYEFPIRPVRTGRWEASQCIKNVVPLPRLFVPHGVRHDR